jgi:hypothetical protein
LPAARVGAAVLTDEMNGGAGHPRPASGAGMRTGYPIRAE